MKALAVVLVLSLGCGSKSDAPGANETPGARPSVADPIGYCSRLEKVIVRRKKCFPEDVSLRMALEDARGKIANPPKDADAKMKVAIECADQLDSMASADQPALCPLDMLATEQTELEKFLGDFYGRRTAAPKTGDELVDAALGKLVEKRDAACACKDLKCVKAASEGLDPSLPSTAKPDATEAATKMVEEVARCKQKLVSHPS